MTHLLAAVDLGSNSFRLLLGQVVQKAEGIQIYQIDPLKETVRLAAGLDSNNYLSESAIARAMDTLTRFGAKLRHAHPTQVRAVGTNTFRVARNIGEFLPLAEVALGFPIEVIGGQEEARLVFSGVAHTLPPTSHKRLVIDIGGGSTEVIIGQGMKPILMSSLSMGCVSYSQRFFANGKIDAFQLKQAELAAQREIEGMIHPYRQMGWQEVYGSSGTVKALFSLLTASGMEKNGMTRAGLMQLKKRILQAGDVTTEATVERVPDLLSSIKRERAEVLPGGLAILCALFDALNIDTMYPGEGALLLGVLHDLLGRVPKRGGAVS